MRDSAPEIQHQRFSTRYSAHAAACFAGVALQAGAPGRTQVAAVPCGLTSPIYCLLCRRYDSSIGVKGGKDKLWPATLEKGVVSACAAGTAGTRAGAAHQPLQLLPRRWQPCSCMSARLCCARCKTSQPASQPQPSCTPHSTLCPLASPTIASWAAAASACRTRATQGSGKSRESSCISFVYACMPIGCG